MILIYEYIYIYIFLEHLLFINCITTLCFGLEHLLFINCITTLCFGLCDEEFIPPDNSSR